MHVYPGDKIELDLINNLNESTNLHFHGLHVSPKNNSDNVFLEILPGKTQHYSVNIPKDHLQVRSGTIHICIIFLMNKLHQVYLD